MDKPTGISSNAALQRVKRLYNAQKAGHTGSLDPLATGLLPICFGQATKACEYLLAADKRYVTQIKLGETTDTYDSEGSVLTSRPISFSDAELQIALEQFRGEISQVPPMYSALKQNGQPLYKMARAGGTVERQARQMTVYSLQANRLGNDLIELEVHSSSGFYVRSLAFDLGEALGCGAHVVSLRRIAKQDLKVDDALSLEQLESLAQSHKLEECLQSVEILLQHLPTITVSEAITQRLLNGLSVITQDLDAVDLTRIYRDDGYLFAIGEVDEQGGIKTHKIFVESGIY